MIGRFKPTKHVLHETLAGEVVLLELSTGVYYSLDEVGGRIWHLLLEGHTAPQIAEQLTQEYCVTSEQALGDVNRILADLQRNGLAEAADA
jgi:hypothetical protein